MKHLTLVPAILLATPALAHDGVHITPHGAEWMPVFMGLAAIATAAVIALRSRVRAKGFTGGLTGGLAGRLTGGRHGGRTGGRARK